MREILERCSAMKEEIKDLRERIRKLERFLENPPIVSDTVKGSRPDGTIGPIKITGIPDPEYQRKAAQVAKYRQVLEEKESELVAAMAEAEAYIQKIDKAELRIMFRLYFIDGLTDAQVAARMNVRFPSRAISYTSDSVKKRRQRFLEKIEENF